MAEPTTTPSKPTMPKRPPAILYPVAGCIAGYILGTTATTLAGNVLGSSPKVTAIIGLGALGLLMGAFRGTGLSFFSGPGRVFPGDGPPAGILGVLSWGFAGVMLGGILGALGAGALSLALGLLWAKPYKMTPL